MNLFLLDASTAQAAVVLARSKIQEVFDDESFILEVGLGLIKVEFRVSEGVADIGEQNPSTGASSTDPVSTQSYVLIAAMAGGFVFFAAMLFAWRRKCYKDDAQHDSDGGTTHAPASITINVDDGYATEEPLESPYTESPYSANLAPYNFLDRPLSEIMEVAESRCSMSTDSESRLGLSKSYSHDSASVASHTIASADGGESDIDSPSGLQSFIGMYNSSPTEGGSIVSTGSSSSSILGANKRYRRNDFIHAQMADAASVSSGSDQQQLSTILDESSSSVNSSLITGDDTRTEIDVDHLLNRTRDSETEQDDDLLFSESV